MAEVPDIDIVDGIPTGGTGTVPTLSKTNTLVGAVNETAPATDTASSGTNGRLQRIAQRLTSLIALLPTALSAGGSLKTLLHDGTSAATIKAASTAPVAGDTAVVVGIHPSSVNPNGQNTAANSAPVVLAEYGKTVLKRITMTADTAILASGDIIADTQQLDGAFRVTDGAGILQSLSIIEADAQGAAYTIWFLQTSTTFGSENGAPSISDANITAGYLHHIDVGAGDFKTLNGAKVASFRNIGAAIKAVSGTDDLYIAITNGTGTPTYAGGTIDLVLGIQQD